MGRKILIKEHCEFKNDGSPCVIKNTVDQIRGVNEVYHQYHVQTEEGFYCEVKRRSFTMLK
jgi:hypothetical protein